MIMSPFEADHHLDFITLSLTVLTRKLRHDEQHQLASALFFGTFFEVHWSYEPIRSMDELHLQQSSHP